MSSSLTSGTYPRGAAAHGPLAAIGSSFARWGRAIWRGMSAVGASRARWHMLSLAAQYEHSDPALARQLRASAQSLDRD